jgi:hypothetical protein
MEQKCNYQRLLNSWRDSQYKEILRETFKKEGLDWSEFHEWEQKYKNLSEKVNRSDSKLLQHLQELLTSDLVPKGVSGITQKAYDKRVNEGNTGVTLSSVHLNYPRILELGFTSESTGGGKTQMSHNGQELGGYDDHYTEYIQFSGLDKIMTPDIQQLLQSQVIQQLINVFDQCDVQVYCNCPSFYYGGDYEDLQKRGGNILKYQGPKGHGIWRGRHQASGGLADPYVRVCKHLYQIIDELDTTWVKQIAQKLTGKQSGGISTTPSPTGVKTTKQQGTVTDFDIDQKTGEVTVEPKPQEMPVTSNKKAKKVDRGTGVDEVTREDSNDTAKDISEETSPTENVDPLDAIKVLEEEENDLKDEPFPNAVSLDDNENPPRVKENLINSFLRRLNV